MPALQPPAPDRPPIEFKAPKKAPRYRVTKTETFQRPDGTWGQRAIAYAPTTSKAKPLTTRIEVTPLQARTIALAKKHSGH